MRRSFSSDLGVHNFQSERRCRAGDLIGQARLIDGAHFNYRSGLRGLVVAHDMWQIPTTRIGGRLAASWCVLVCHLSTSSATLLSPLIAFSSARSMTGHLCSSIA